MYCPAQDPEDFLAQDLSAPPEAEGALGAEGVATGLFTWDDLGTVVAGVLAAAAAAEAALVHVAGADGAELVGIP